MAGRVGDDFMDVQGPLKQLERAAKAPLGIKLVLTKLQVPLPRNVLTSYQKLLQNLIKSKIEKLLWPVVRKVDSAIHWMVIFFNRHKVL